MCNHRRDEFNQPTNAPHLFLVLLPGPTCGKGGSGASGFLLLDGRGGAGRCPPILVPVLLLARVVNLLACDTTLAAGRGLLDQIGLVGLGKKEWS